MRKILFPVVAALLAIALVSCNSREKQVEGLVKQKLDSLCTANGYDYAPGKFSVYTIAPSSDDKSDAKKFKSADSTEVLHSTCLFFEEFSDGSPKLKYDNDPIDRKASAEELDKFYKGLGIVGSMYYVIHKFTAKEDISGTEKNYIVGMIVYPEWNDPRTYPYEKAAVYVIKEIDD